MAGALPPDLGQSGSSKSPLLVLAEHPAGREAHPGRQGNAAGDRHAAVQAPPDHGVPCPRWPPLDRDRRLRQRRVRAARVAHRVPRRGRPWATTASPRGGPPADGRRAEEPHDHCRRGPRRWGGTFEFFAGRGSFEFFAGRIVERAAPGGVRAGRQNSFSGGARARGLRREAVWPLHVAASGSVRTVKQHLTAIPMLCDWLVVSQVLPVNPAAAVQGPKQMVTKGATAVLSPAEARKLLEMIDTRPGGASPLCYSSDVSDSAVEAYRARTR